MTTQPTIVFCHGSFHTPLPYGSLVKSLRAKGFPVVIPQLAIADFAGVDVDSPPPAQGWPTQAGDAQLVRGLIDSLVKEDKRVLVVAHSSGGWTGTEAATSEELYEKSRKAQGKSGGIIGIFYLCAYLMAPGESVNSIFTLFQSDQMMIFELHVSQTPIFFLSLHAESSV